ncbi:serine/arginine repetitive matrix protein 1-like [Scylla paramamosain]|uniref:serine/arginine repetitive matrix protein 1-like n=1 Tax=Scylla paramamosain TaxID=85552 RepID=UPI003082EA82
MSEQIEKTSTKKKMKKGSRFLRALKKLLWCCCCKAQQQDEEAEEYVVVESPRQDEGEKVDVCEESGSLADSGSETAQSLQVTCGQSPECESAQGLPEECVALEDPVHEAGQSFSDDEYVSTPDVQTSSKEDDDSPEESLDCEAMCDESLIESIYALIEEPLKPSATEALKCVEAMPSPSKEQDKAEGQTERCAAKRRRRRKKKKVPHEEEDIGGEWQLVCKKPRRKKNETVIQEAIKPSEPEPQRVSRKSKKPRRNNRCPQDDRDRVRLSWQESTVEVAVPVPPNRRRHVIGTRGDTIRQLQQQYPAVRVSVPLPQDLESREVIIEGSKTQADAVALQITLRLQAIEENLREAEQLRQERKRTVLKVQVAPHMRRHVVGPRGETLKRLAQEHPTVRVTVPPPSNTRTTSVSIKGPRNEAAVVADCIMACVQAAGQRQRQRLPNKGKLRRGWLRANLPAAAPSPVSLPPAADPGPRRLNAAWPPPRRPPPPAARTPPPAARMPPPAACTPSPAARPPSRRLPLRHSPAGPRHWPAVSPSRGRSST